LVNLWTYIRNNKPSLYENIIPLLSQYLSLSKFEWNITEKNNIILKINKLDKKSILELINSNILDMLSMEFGVIYITIRYKLAEIYCLDILDEFMINYDQAT